MVQTDEERRELAVKQLKKKREFSADLFAYVVVNAFIVGIWAVTGSGFFWPIFPILAWGMGLIFHAWDVYQRPPTEEQIRREMDRLK